MGPKSISQQLAAAQKRAEEARVASEEAEMRAVAARRERDSTKSLGTLAERRAEVARAEAMVAAVDAEVTRAEGRLESAELAAKLANDKVPNAALAVTRADEIANAAVAAMEAALDKYPMGMRILHADVHALKCAANAALFESASAAAGVDTEVSEVQAAQAFLDAARTKAVFARAVVDFGKLNLSMAQMNARKDTSSPDEPMTLPVVTVPDHLFHSLSDFTDSGSGGSDGNVSAKPSPHVDETGSKQHSPHVNVGNSAMAPELSAARDTSAISPEKDHSLRTAVDPKHLETARTSVDDTAALLEENEEDRLPNETTAAAPADPSENVNKGNVSNSSVENNLTVSVPEADTKPVNPFASSSRDDTAAKSPYLVTPRHVTSAPKNGRRITAPMMDDPTNVVQVHSSPASMEPEKANDACVSQAEVSSELRTASKVEVPSTAPRTIISDTQSVAPRAPSCEANVDVPTTVTPSSTKGAAAVSADQKPQAAIQDRKDVATSAFGGNGDAASKLNVPLTPVGTQVVPSGTQNGNKKREPSRGKPKVRYCERCNVKEEPKKEKKNFYRGPNGNRTLCLQCNLAWLVERKVDQGSVTNNSLNVEAPVFTPKSSPPQSTNPSPPVGSTSSTAVTSQDLTKKQLHSATTVPSALPSPFAELSRNTPKTELTHTRTSSQNNPVLQNSPSSYDPYGNATYASAPPPTNRSAFDPVAANRGYSAGRTYGGGGGGGYGCDTRGPRGRGGRNPFAGRNPSPRQQDHSRGGRGGRYSSAHNRNPFANGTAERRGGLSHQTHNNSYPQGDGIYGHPPAPHYDSRRTPHGAIPTHPSHQIHNSYDDADPHPPAGPYAETGPYDSYDNYGRY